MQQIKVRIGAVILLVVFLMIVSVAVVSAQSTTTRTATSSATRSAARTSIDVNRTQVRTRLKELREARQLSAAERQQRITELRQMAATERCRVVAQNMQARIEFYANNKDRYTAHYNRLLDNLQKAIVRLKELGQNTTTVEAAYSRLNELVSKLRSTYVSLEAALTAAQALACDFEPGERVTSIEEARTHLKALRQTHTEIRKEIREVLVAQLRKLGGARSSSQSSSATP